MEQTRYKGRFVKKKKREWLENVSIASKRRKVEREQSESTVEGRRIVDIKVLADELWCDFCSIPLSLRDIENEETFGLASSFRVRCPECLVIHNVHTAKSSIHRGQQKLFNVNSKAALAVIDSGFGLDNLNTWLSAVNIPIMWSTLFKRHERVVGPAIEIIAERSCRSAIEEEKRLTLSNSVFAQKDDNSPLNNNIDEEVPLALDGLPSSISSSTPLISQQETLTSPEESINSISTTASTLVAVTPLKPSTPVSLTASFDAGWQKRGTGRTYDSLTGHSSLIGHNSRKILSYATRKKRCAKCKAGQDKDSHDCRKNYDGSAKSMEADMAVQLVTKNSLLRDANAIVTTLIGDDDSSAIAAVRKESDHDIEKWSDFNHASKALNNACYKITPKMSTQVIDYLNYNFSIALHQNKENPTAIREALLSIVPHAFDDHSHCGDWCGFRKDPTNYQHKYLPDGKGLSGSALKSELTKLFTKLANKAKELAPCGSSQANESFNRVVLSKHPKHVHHGRSESLDFRVSSAVCQMNVGTSYITEAAKEINLSPGHNTMKYRKIIDKKTTKS